MANRKGFEDKLERPADVLFTKTDEDKEDLIRSTYYLTPLIQESIRIMSFVQKEQKSVLVRNMLLKILPIEILAEAANNLQIELPKNIGEIKTEDIDITEK